MRAVFSSLAILASVAVFAAGSDDAVLSFSTQGPDRYADGTTVMDGECYALVWSEDGNFEGFSADGAPLDENDRLLIVAPVAEGGRCPDMLFQVPAEVAVACAGGHYGVYLMDTRLRSDSGAVAPAGADEGKLSLLNGYGRVDAEISSPGSYVQASSAAVCGVAATAASAPKESAQPRVKGLRVEGDRVVLTVEDRAGFMRVQGTSDLSASGSAGAATETPGSGGDVELYAPKTGSSGFYRVIFNGK